MTCRPALLFARVIKRVWFPSVVLFWLTMNVLLWRSEMRAGKDAGSPVPVAAVWERVLTAPDDSALDIFQAGKKVGNCRWVPRVNEDVPGADAPPPDDPNAPEGRVKRVTGYTVTLDGSLAVDDSRKHLRFTVELGLDARQQWRTFRLRCIRRPDTWEIAADAATETATFRMGDPPNQWEQRLTFAQLSEPQAVFAAFGLPVPPGWLPTFLPPGLPAATNRLALDLHWDARMDWMNLGSAQARAYRVRARLFDKYEVAVMISRVGEILRLELPNQIRLVSEALAGLGTSPR